MNQPSTSVIHSIASDGKSDQVVTWFLKLIFQNKIDCGLRNLQNCNSDICCLCGPTMLFCGNSTGIDELIVDGLLVNIGICIVSPLCLSSLAK